MTQSSLLRHLQNANPSLHCFKADPKDRTNTSAQYYNTPVEIYSWNDFDLSTLDNMFGGILFQSLSQTNVRQLSDPSAVPSYLRSISNEDSLDALLVNWTQSIVSEALSMACQNHDQLKHLCIQMLRGGQAKLRNSDDSPLATAQSAPKSKKRKLKPDWAGAILDPDQSDIEGEDLPESLIPGDTKLGRKFMSEKIHPGPVIQDPATNQWLKPIKQIFTYCVKANARYGFLISDKHLVLVRVRPLSQAHEGNRALSAARSAELEGALDFKCIDWNSNGNRQLTVNLALWWIHLLAANNGDIDFAYAPLGEEALKDDPSITRVAPSQAGNSQATSNSDIEGYVISPKNSQSSALPSYSPGQKRKREHGSSRERSRRSR